MQNALFCTFFCMTDFWCQSLIVILHQILVTCIVQPSNLYNHGRDFWCIIRSRRGRAVCVSIHCPVLVLASMCRSSMCGSTPSRGPASNVQWGGSSVNPTLMPASHSSISRLTDGSSLCPHSCGHNYPAHSHTPHHITCLQTKLVPY